MGKGNAVGEHTVRVGRHSHLLLHLSGNEHLKDAVYAGKLRQDSRLNKLRRNLSAVVGDYAELEYRELVRVEAAYFGLIHAVRKSEDAYMVLYRAFRIGHIRAVTKRRQDDGIALKAGGLDAFQPLRTFYHPLDGSGHVLHYTFGVSRRVRCGNYDQWELNFREQFYLQRVIGENAADQQDDYCE